MTQGVWPRDPAPPHVVPPSPLPGGGAPPATGLLLWLLLTMQGVPPLHGAHQGAATRLAFRRGAGWPSLSAGVCTVGTELRPREVPAQGVQSKGEDAG